MFIRFIQPVLIGPPFLLGLRRAPGRRLGRPPSLRGGDRPITGPARPRRPGARSRNIFRSFEGWNALNYRYYQYGRRTQSSALPMLAASAYSGIAALVHYMRLVPFTASGSESLIAKVVKSGVYEHYCRSSYSTVSRETLDDDSTDVPKRPFYLSG